MKKIALVILLMMAEACSRAPVAIPIATDRVRASHAEGDLSGITVEDARWDAAAETLVKLERQQIALPKLEKDGVTEIKVKSLYGATLVAFLLTWADVSQDKLAQLGKFGDAVAIEFPALADQLPDSAMGGTPGGAKQVVIHMWKAMWQEDAAGNVTGIKSFYPNTWADTYLFEKGPNKEAQDALERVFTTSVAADNPLARLNAPVRDLEAMGFGSINFAAEQSSTGSGKWSNGQWQVAIVRPIQRAQGAIDTAHVVRAAFAVWDGSQMEVGARKMVSGWFPIQFVKQ